MRVWIALACLAVLASVALIAPDVLAQTKP